MMNDLNRRTAIAGVGAAVSAALFAGTGSTALAAGEPTLTELLAKCIETGELCVAHCVAEHAKGNKDLAKCSLKVHEMLAACRAMQTLLAFKSDRAKDMASVCIKTCDDCIAACAEHKAHWAHNMHLECKHCHDACEVAMKALKKVYG